jgi:hypothetical protein
MEEYGTASELNQVKDKVETLSEELIDTIVNKIVAPKMTEEVEAGMSPGISDAVVGSVFCTLLLRQFTSLAREIALMEQVLEQMGDSEHIGQARNFLHQKASFFLAYKKTFDDTLFPEITALNEKVLDTFNKNKEHIKDEG